MTRTKHIIAIKGTEFLPVIANFRESGYRLVQVSCLKEEEGLGLHYTFDKQYGLVDLYFSVASDSPVPSITAHFPYAFLYENEIHDLYGLTFEGINVDFKGLLYKLAVPRPFNQETAKETPRPKRKRV
jgi:ech hydrogenase subunit D